MDDVLPLLLWGTVLSICGALFCVLYARKILNNRARKNEELLSTHGDFPNVPKHPRWPREDR